MMKQIDKLPITDRILIYRLPTFIKRLFRIDVFNYLSHNDLDIVVLRKKLLFFSGNRLVHRVRIDRGSRPLRDGITIVGKKLFYGDYWRNPNRVPCHIYTIDLTDFTREIFYTFDWVRHIHFIQVDEFNNDSLLVGTGDSNRESGIYRLNIRSRNVEILAEGAQKFRACSIIQTPLFLFYGSDDPDGENYIYRFDKATKSVKPVKEIKGPAYYSFVDINNSFYIGTTIEKRKTHRAIIYKSDNAGKDWYEFAKFRKDFLPLRLFGNGVIEFLPPNDYTQNINIKLTGLI